jgi:hypothetical protein
LPTELSRKKTWKEADAAAASRARLGGGAAKKAARGELGEEAVAGEVKIKWPLATGKRGLFTVK